MINSHQQISLAAVAGMAGGLAAGATSNPTTLQTVSAFGRLVYNNPSALAEHASWCLKGVRAQGLKAISYFFPSVKVLARREVAVETLVRPLGLLTGEPGIKAAGSVSLGTLGWVAAAPVFQLAKIFANACHRSIESGEQDHLIETVRKESGSVVLAKGHLERNKDHYKALSERSVIPGWKSLLLNAVPTALLAPELGITALAAGAVAGAAQIAGNAWEQWANSSMHSKTNECLKNIEFFQRAVQFNSNTDELEKRLVEHSRAVKAAKISHPPISQ